VDLRDQVFHEEEGGMFFDRMTRERPFSEKTAEKIDAEVAALIKEAVVRAEAILKANKKPLEELTQALLEKETIDEAEVTEILKNAKLPKEAKLHN
jgi:cell division protease FtsH